MEIGSKTFKLIENAVCCVLHLRIKSLKIMGLGIKTRYNNWAKGQEFEIQAGCFPIYILKTKDRLQLQSRKELGSNHWKSPKLVSVVVAERHAAQPHPISPSGKLVVSAIVIDPNSVLHQTFLTPYISIRDRWKILRYSKEFQSPYHRLPTKDFTLASDWQDNNFFSMNSMILAARL